MRRGFSLVELSIVLVIIGLLVGGVLAGQSLIRASELRDVTVQINKYQTIIAAFRDKYFALPGDFATATAFWGKDATLCNADAGTTATPGTCNGNGNGQVENNNESGRFFQQLAMAELLEGTTSRCSVGTDCPTLRFDNGTIYPKWDTSYNKGLNVIKLTGKASITTALFTPEQGWNIDGKADDGMPCSGKVMMSAGGGATSGCVSDNNNTCTTTPTYNLSSTSINCAAQFYNF